MGVTVTGVDYMEGMIPHHSIAILTSERSQIKDIRVREIADEIIKAQRREIMEMQWLINDIKENGIVETEEEKEKRPLPKFEGSLTEVITVFTFERKKRKYRRINEGISDVKL